jgi:hypothetical protein
MGISLGAGAVVFSEPHRESQSKIRYFFHEVDIWLLNKPDAQAKVNLALSGS